MILKYFPFLLILFLVTSCNREKDQKDIINHNKFSDPVIRDIYTYQDQRNSEKLLPYLKDPDPVYRVEAALSFSSVQDTTAVNQLSYLLDDPSPEVRRSTAYALGQTGGTLAEQKLIQALYSEEVPVVRKELLEALGKCATDYGLQELQIQEPSDSLEKAGLAWGLYRAGIRGVSNGKIVEMAVKLMEPDNDFDARLGAANFLYRSQGLDLEAFKSEIKNTAVDDQAPAVRMAAVRALGKIDSDDVTKSLADVATSDPDYRVRVNAIYAFRDHEYKDVKESIFKLLEDESVNTAIAAATYLDNYAKDDFERIFEIALKDDMNWRVRALLLSASLRLSPDKTIVTEVIQKNYKNSGNPYEKANLLSALETDVTKYSFIENEIFLTNEPVIATSGLQTLADMRTAPSFPPEMEQRFADIFKKAIQTGDLALIGISSDIISNPELNFKEVYKDLSFLEEAKNKLTLPRDHEALQILERAISYFEDKEYIPVENDYNHPINWEFIQNVPKGRKVLVETEKGGIELEMLVEHAPGSVANFLQLAGTGYYDSKVFHRVVPNFVIQGGCPRGDGWGSEEYSIRSELGPLRYRDGYVGMASAGKDTEGVQWFITHSPTPHLDGRYTIFARVTDGMEVVHKIEVGDKIKKIKFL